MTPQDLKTLQATLWKSADDLRANSDLRSSEYSTPVMGLIFLKFADNKYRQFETRIKIVQDWYRDASSQGRVKEAVETILDDMLPEESFGTVIFKATCERVYNNIYERAYQGLPLAV